MTGLNNQYWAVSKAIAVIKQGVHILTEITANIMMGLKAQFKCF